MAPILVTGAAGFIGHAISINLLKRGYLVIGIDNLNSYYDPRLKKSRLKTLTQFEEFEFIELDIQDKSSLMELFAKQRFEYVVHLAAQAGVRYSLQNPQAYVDSNITGFLNILECCRFYPVIHMVYASSSSVYGNNKKVPFSEVDNVDEPVSFYAATKKSNELMAACYSSLYGVKATGLRFFTVYGPWMRPDMAILLFANAIHADKPIKIFNYGKMERDFTYIDDIVDGVLSLLFKIKNKNDRLLKSVYNIGNNNPVQLLKLVNILEKELQKKAILEMLPMQDGDVEKTYADISAIQAEVNFKPSTSLELGVKHFCKWFSSEYLHIIRD
ncbi:MAG: SDR family NAD(P)-dependent oxidoreductase [Chitinophagaceae bacterium]|nr:SDR family NAD(P)-dependent oxidoreductase [Oligoflexus sp.]